LLSQLRGQGRDAVHQSERDDAGIVVINTCGFVEEARQESIDTILRYVEAKQKGLVDKVYVTGCLSQRYGGELEREIPEVDAFFGTRELPRLLKTLKADYKQELVGERLITTPSHYAYLKIAEGCDRPCAFCAIPLMRGGHISEPMEALVAQATRMALNGTKELILIAQDLTYYGLDIYKKRNLSELLERLADVEGIAWIRLQYAYPAGFPMDILEVMAKHNTICNYLDMPLQHGDDVVLKTMRRGITRAKQQDLIAKIRDMVPDIALRTTLIVGHPGEGEAEFENLVSFVEQNRFERLGVFTYSHEERTAAYNLPDTTPEEVKQERMDIIMGIQQDISAEINQGRIGKEYACLIDRKEGGYYIGRTQYDSPDVDNEVLIDARTGGPELPPGSMIQVRVVDATEFDLIATPL
jgi:ribosomal protein S12 methylthiotransferase